MTDEELVESYERDEAFNNLQPGTLRVRRGTLLKFSREIGGFANATEQGVIEWLGRDISAKTRNTLLSTLNVFYVWALRGDHGKPIFPKDTDGLDFNPIINIKKPRMHPRNPRPMPDDDLQKALAAADTRMRAWILLGCLEGCRCMEIAGLDRSDIREATMTLRLLGKGDKERFLPLHPDVLVALRALPMPAEGRLWDATAADVSRRGNRFLHAHGIKPTMHTLRHHFGTAVYRSSKDLRLTQELMGHSSPTTTAIYAAADQTQAAGVVGGLKV